MPNHLETMTVSDWAMVVGGLATIVFAVHRLIRYFGGTSIPYGTRVELDWPRLAVIAAIANLGFTAIMLGVRVWSIGGIALTNLGLLVLYVTLMRMIRTAVQEEPVRRLAPDLLGYAAGIAILVLAAS